MPRARSFCLLLVSGFRPSHGKTGMYGPPLRRKRKVSVTRLVCANVYGLYWSESLLARMECAALSSPLVIQSRETASGYGFGERRVRPLCHLLIRQQTWQETIISVGIAKLQLHQPTPGADMVHSSRARPTPYVPSYSLGPLRPRCGGCAR